MRILHIGGYPTVLGPLVEFQTSNAHAVQCLAQTQGFFPRLGAAWVELESRLPRILDGAPEIIHFHGREALATDTKKTIEVLARLRATGAKLIFHCYDYDSASDRHIAPLLSHFSCLALSNVDSHELVNPHLEWAWIPLGINLSTSAPQPRDYTQGHVRILHIPFATRPQDTSFIIDVVEKLKQRKLLVDFSVVAPESIEDVGKLTELLSAHDVVIERLSAVSPGVVALHAMALGKTALTSNKSSAQARWEILANMPLLDVDTNNLERRLEAILKEPRCLKDYNTRARQYVERYHRPSLMHELLMDLYSKK